MNHSHNLAPSLAPSPPPLLNSSGINISPESFFLYNLPVPKIVFDLVTLSFIAAVLLLSLIAFAFIFHLHFRSSQARHLQRFNCLWILRSLLVSLSSFWAVNEILRLPIVRKKYINPFFPSATLEQQANNCKLHVVLSLGFFEPGFLITLLFLVNVSIKKINSFQIWTLLAVLALCSPIAVSQIYFVYFSPLEARLPKFMTGSYTLSSDNLGNNTVLCKYPFFSFLTFAAFTLAYAAAFLLSCWKVMAVVINKRIAKRINILAITVMVTLAAQLFCLTVSMLLMPEYAVYGCVVLVMFLCIAWSMAVGMFLLVVKPINEALEVVGNCCQWNSDLASRRRMAAEDGLLQ